MALFLARNMPLTLPEDKIRWVALCSHSPHIGRPVSTVPVKQCDVPVFARLSLATNDHNPAIREIGSYDTPDTCRHRFAGLAKYAIRSLASNGGICGSTMLIITQFTAPEQATGCLDKTGNSPHLQNSPER
jgi:hypothetical protein